MRKKFFSRGFTLMELLVSIAVLSVIGVIFLVVFSNSLRGGNKAQIVLAIKQNGQAVLETIDKTIREADNVICPVIVSPYTSAQSTNLVIVKDGIYTRYRFEVISNENGLIKQDNPVKQAETDTGFINRVCSVNDLMSSQAIILTDTNSKTGVSISGGLFTRSKQTGFKDVVTIQFDVGPGAGVIAGTSFSVDPVNFKTTIQLR